MLFGGLTLFLDRSSTIIMDCKYNGNQMVCESSNSIILSNLRVLFESKSLYDMPLFLGFSNIRTFIMRFLMIYRLKIKYLINYEVVYTVTFFNFINFPN